MMLDELDYGRWTVKHYDFYNSPIQTIADLP